MFVPHLVSQLVMVEFIFGSIDRPVVSSSPDRFNRFGRANATSRPGIGRNNALPCFSFPRWISFGRYDDSSSGSSSSNVSSDGSSAASVTSPVHSDVCNQVLFNFGWSCAG